MTSLDSHCDPLLLGLGIFSLADHEAIVFSDTEQSVICLVNPKWSLLWPMMSFCCRFGFLPEWIPRSTGHKSTRPSATATHNRSKTNTPDGSQTWWECWRWSRRKHCLPLSVCSFIVSQANKQKYCHFGEKLPRASVLCVWLSAPKLL